MPKAMLIDTSKCMGCRGCQVACKAWNDRPAEKTTNWGSYQNPAQLSASTWNLVQFYEGPDWWVFRPHRCVHCTEASCINVCPTGSMHREGEFVINNQEWCIGCGYCVVACPFGAVHREPIERTADLNPQYATAGSAQKCIFCIDRVKSGYVPACAKTCPPRAIQFGERDDLIAAAHKRVAYLVGSGFPEARLYGETELGGLGQMYILVKSPSAMGLPEKPVVATASVLMQWLSGLVVAGVVAAVPFWLLFRRRKRLEEEHSRIGGQQ